MDTSMANTDAPRVPSPSPEHRRVAAGQFERFGLIRHPVQRAVEVGGILRALRRLDLTPSPRRNVRVEQRAFGRVHHRPPLTGRLQERGVAGR